jgi:transposase
VTAAAELAAEIRRLFFVEHWKVGTIGRQLCVHEDVVRRVTGLTSPRRVVPAPKAGLCEPYAAFIEETLAKYPTLRATRLFEMVRQRGYGGSVRTLREFVAGVRPTPKAKAYLSVETLVAEQAQVDWAHVGRIKVGETERDLWCFVLVLGWSRAMFAELVFDLTAASLCRSLVRAGVALGGLPRVWLFDNPKVVVLERHGDAVRFHPLLLELAGRLHVQPRLCGVRRPQSKGKVERSIRYLRDAFFAARQLTGLEDGNRQLRAFVADVAHRRPHPRFESRTVGDCLAEEQPRLMPLPSPLPETDLVTPVVVDKTAFVRFDRNRYSVPWDLAGRTLTLAASDLEVHVLDGDRVVADHLRRWERGATVEKQDHREGLLEHRRLVEFKGRDLLRESVPRIDELAEAWVNAGQNVGSNIARALRLWELYADLLPKAVDVLLARGTYDLGALALVCEQLRRERQRVVPIPVSVPSHGKDRDVVPHALESYDD